MALLDHSVIGACRKQRGLVDQVGQIRTTKSWRATGNNTRIDLVANRDLAHVDFQNVLATTDVGQAHGNLAVKAPRTQKRAVQHVWTVGRCDHDHAVIDVKTVHLDQQLVQGLFTLIVTTAHAGSTLTTDRVNLVDKDNARCLLLGLLEHVAYTTRADTHKHFNKVRSGNSEERHLGLAGDGLGQQSLTRTRRAGH